MDRFIGIDVHGQSCTVVVMGPSGRRLGEYIVETSARVLVDRMISIAGDKHVCMEEGTQSEWLYEVLEPHVKRLVVTQPLRRLVGSKSDSIDAWALADVLRRDAVERPVFKSPQTLTALRQAARGYIVVVRDMVRAKLRLRALFRSRGIPTDEEIYDPGACAKWVRKLPPSYRPLAELLSEQLEGLSQSQEAAERWLLQEAKRTPVARRLATAPGIGPIRAALLVAIVVTPARFRTTRQFWSYSGLAIVTRSSSDWTRDKTGWTRKPTVQTRGLNRNRHPELKSIFKGAATTVIRQMPNHPLHQDFQRMTNAGIKPNLATLTLARRIAAATLSMWKHQQDYDPSRVKAPVPPQSQ
jgi:transposase